MNSPAFNLGQAGLVLSLRVYFQTGEAAPVEQGDIGDAAVVEIGTLGDYYLTDLPDPGAGYIGTAIVVETATPESALWTYSYAGATGLPGSGSVPISIARVQAYLGVTGDDTYLTQLERAAVEDVQRGSGRYLGAPKAFEDVFDITRPTLRLVTRGESFPRLQISQPAALSALTVWERGSVADAWEEVAKLDDGDQVFELVGRDLYRRIGAWSEGERTVKVAYSFGYAVDTLPAAFDAVLFDLLAERYTGAAQRALGGQVQAASVQGNSVTFRSSSSNGYGMSDSLWGRVSALRWED